MPHLPPVTIRGGSVKITIPVKDADGKPLFDKKTKRDAEPYPPSKKKYPSDVYTASDHHAQIYSIEIYGADDKEVFEFRPKDGKCTIKIYYAISEELPLKHEGKWRGPGGHLHHPKSAHTQE